MTIDEQVEGLMNTLPYLHKSEGGVEGFRERLHLALLEVARDQRHACAESLLQVDRFARKAHQAVMNTPLGDTQGATNSVRKGE